MSFQTPQIGGQGGLAGGGGLLGFLAQGLKGYQEGHKEKTDEHNEKEDRTQKKAEFGEKQKMDDATLQHDNIINKTGEYALSQQIETDNKAKATAQFSTLRDFMNQYPQALKDPHQAEQLLNAANAAGVPLARTKDGGIDPDSLKTQSFGEYTPDQLAKLNAMDPTDRKNALANTKGVPAGFITAPRAKPTYDEQIKMTNAQNGKERADAYVNHYKTTDKIAMEKLPLYKRKQQADIDLKNALTSNDKVSVGKIYAQINELNAHADEARVNAQAIPARLGLMSSSLDLREKELGVSMARLQYDTSPDSLKNLHSTAQSLDQYTDQAQGELDSAERALATYASAQSGGQISPDDKIGQQLQQNIHMINEKVYTSKRQADKARSALVNHQFQGVAMTRQSGGRPTTILPRQSKGGNSVGNANGVADGTTGGGGKYVARGGKWYAK